LATYQTDLGEGEGGRGKREEGVGRVGNDPFHPLHKRSISRLLFVFDGAREPAKKKRGKEKKGKKGRTTGEYIVCLLH